MQLLHFIITTEICKNVLQNVADYYKMRVLLHNEVRIDYILCYYIMQYYKASYCASKRRAVRLAWQPAGRVLH